MIVQGHAHFRGRHGESAALKNLLEREMQESFPLAANESLPILEELRERILDLHARETEAARRLRAAVS
jgi:hypothetical protein